MKKVKKKSYKKSINLSTYIVGALLLCIILVTAGYAAFSASLSIGSGAVVRAKKDIRITGVTPVNPVASAYSNWEDFDVSVASSSFELPYSNSTIEYDVKITNIGNVEMGILSITGLPNNLTYSISNYNLKDKLCDDNDSTKCSLGSETTLHITIGYANNGYNSNNTTYDVDLNFELKEAFSISYIAFDSTAGLPTTILDGETKTITFTNPNPIPYDIGVSNATKSYSSPTLTISAATANVVVTRKYSITYTGFTGSTSGLIQSVGPAGDTIAFNNTTGIPEVVLVTGATSSYDPSNGRLTLSNVLGNVTVMMTNDGDVEIVSITKTDYENVTENSSPQITQNGQSITFDLGVTADSSNYNEDFFITYAITIENDSIHEQKIMATNFTPHIVGSGNVPNVSYAITDVNGNQVANTTIPPKTSETYYLTITIEPQEQGTWGVEGETEVETVENGTITGEISGSTSGDVTGNNIAHFTASITNSFDNQKTFLLSISDNRFSIVDSNENAITTMTINANTTGTYDFYIKNLNGNNYMESPVGLNIDLNYDDLTDSIGVVSLSVDVDPNLTDTIAPVISGVTATITNIEKEITVSWIGNEDNTITKFIVETYESTTSGAGTKINTEEVSGAASGVRVNHTVSVPDDDRYYYFKVYGVDSAKPPNTASAQEITDCSTAAGHCSMSTTQRFKWNFKVRLILTNANSNTGTLTNTSGNVKTYEFNAFYDTTSNATLSGKNSDFSAPSNISNATITYPNGTTSNLSRGNSTATAYAYNNTSGVLSLYHIKGDINVQAAGVNTGTCLAAGTKVLMADFSYKNVEDIQYDDLLAVWDYEKGKVTYEYPLWIESEHESVGITRVTFEDKSYIDFVGDHAIYSIDLNLFVSILDFDNFKVGTRVAKLDSNNKLVSTKVTKIEKISKPVKYYFVGSTTYYNIFANNILTTDRHLMISNLYGFDEVGVWPEGAKDYLSQEENILDYTYFKDVLPYYLYKGFRVQEAGFLISNNMTELGDFKEFIKEFIIDQEMIIDPITINNDRYWMVTTSEDKVTSSNKKLYLRKEGNTYKLPKSNNRYFKGWYNTSDNTIYQPGDELTVYHGTHFVAMYEPSKEYSINTISLNKKTSGYSLFNNKKN